MKENKELINEIVDQLKSKQDLPYREGAWEKFSSLHADPAKKSISVSYFKKYLSAAALLLFGLAFSYYLLRDGSNVVATSSLVSVITNKDTRPTELSPKQDITVMPELLTKSDRVESVNSNTVKNKSHSSLDFVVENKTSLNDLKISNALIEIDSLHSRDVIAHVELNSIKKSPIAPQLANKLTLANASLINNLDKRNDLANNLSPKKFVFGDKFDLGLFISPFSSNNNVKLGLGVTVAYNLSRKFSIRTGASYNNFEVGILKNPLEASSVEKIETEVMENSFNKGNDLAGSSIQTTLLIPNISAITGYVKSVDIPLELKYNIRNSFYVVGGASYSRILNQERNAQYIENNNYNTFSDGFPNDQIAASKAMQTVTKSVKSSEENVKTSGFNGFLNFSVGKKININNRLGVSIEPYYKVPLGEFRRSEMNYSNGGVRIMTNF